MGVRTLIAFMFLALPTVVRPQLRDDVICRPTLAPRATGAQIADDGFNPVVQEPAFPLGGGPRVFLDEAHSNFHTVDGRYSGFVRLLRRDGFVVEPIRSSFTREALAPARILVIANASPPRNQGDPYIPAPSAFSLDEVDVVQRWVAEGGSLLLIADHMPWGGATALLAEAFSFLFSNGYATDAECSADEFAFARADGTLRDHPVTRGRNPTEVVGAVRTITGQAFRSVNPDVQPLLVLAPRTVLLLPTEPWVFSDETPRVPAEGMLQGATLSYGSGRVAAFGEAAMFSAQVSGTERRPMGMNMPTASENPQFLLNVMHWLAGLLPER